MNKNNRHTLALLLTSAVVVVYLGWLAWGFVGCVRRGGIPVPLPTGTQCAAKLR